MGLLRVLPGLVLLTSFTAWAPLALSQEIESDRPSISTLSTGISTATDQNNPQKLEPTHLNLSPLIVPSEPRDSFHGQPLAKVTLDSPPSPEVATTLCEGSAQSLAGQVIITSQTICQSGLTPPSLWWTQEQVAQELRTSGKLVNDWSAQLKTLDSPGQVRLVVNPQMWSLMDYFERYDFVSNFGIAASSFGYQTEVYNTKGTRLASYVCQEQEAPENLGSNCRMDLGSSLNFGSRGSRKSFL